MDFGNSTDLDGARLERRFERHVWPYRHDRLRVRVRYSRGAPFSGTCYYADECIYVNLGRDNAYPYRVGTHIARSQSNRTHWWRETYELVLADGYELALFVFLHEFYHYLVKAAGRNPRRKEAKCDRFACRVLVDHYGAAILDARGRPVPQENWDFQDVYAFVAAAPQVKAGLQLTLPPAPLREIPVAIYGMRTADPRGGGV